MSGITGIFRRDGRDVDPDDIKKMNDKIAHRGPDGSKTWCEGPVALGHQMLHTTQESLHEELPFENEESGLVITADARIDNRKELAPQLGIEDNEFVSDSYFILKAYEKWGEKCPEELLGDFAFAIWDKKNEILFCSRDHMGVRPIYYYISRNVVFFSTEIKAIIEHSEVPSIINEMKVATFLDEEFAKDEISTFYKDVMRLKPAHSFGIGKNDYKIQKYWELDPTLRIHYDSEEEYIKKFREIFSKAIECRLRSAFPIGSDLSGGLDSSSVVCMAKSLMKNSKNNLNTFSYVFDDFPDIDERLYIDEVIKTGRIEPHFIKSDYTSPLENLENILYYEDQPYRNPFLSILINTFKEIHELGIRTLLSGVGGDIVIYTGKNYFLELAVTFQWRKLVKEIREFSEIKGVSVYKKFYGLVLLPLIPITLKKFIKKILGLFKKNNDSNFKFLNKHFEEKLRDNENIMPFKTFFNSYGTKSVRNFHYCSIMDNVSSQDHFELLNLASGIYSIDYCHPYYDKRLIEFCYGIPSEMKMKSWNRYIQRISTEGILPETIRWRTNKANFRSFVIKNLYKLEKDRLDAMVSDPQMIADYVNIEMVKQIYKKYDNNEVVSFTEVYYLFISTILYTWFKQINIC